MLRADMDTLQVTEATGLLYASKIEGVSHVCGHDLITAAAVWLS
jgi:hippurate hydrolase